MLNKKMASVLLSTIIAASLLQLQMQIHVPLKQQQHGKRLQLKTRQVC